MKKLLLLLTIFLTVNSFGQSDLWKKLDASETTGLNKLTRGSNPSKFDVYSININALKSRLAEAPSRGISQNSNVIIAFPNAEGEMQNYRIFEASVLDPILAAKMPEIQSYVGQCIDDPTASIYFSTTIFGLHTMTFAADKSACYIDPYSKDLNHYMVYSKSDLTTNKIFSCGYDDIAPRPNFNVEEDETVQNRSENGLFKTYRLAFSCTIEYAAFHVNAAGLNSGTLAQKKAAVLAAQNVSMVRINGVYERDFAIKLVIVANNLDIINVVSDDLDNNNSAANGFPLLGQNQAFIDTVIGDANYDIGHVATTGAGGVASQGPCQSGSKARGVTGINDPVGDPYDIDYVAHEMGHQFGASHTYNNSCGGNVSAASAYEPGSGSTIMAYAGICPPNVQNNSDAYFHSRSILQVQNYINGTGNCAVAVANNNAAPVVAPITNYTIPKGTAFALTANATDADGDVLTYCWEHYNNQSSTQPPVATSISGPNYRSLNPSASPTRFFPRFSDVLAGNLATTWEVTPTVGRVLTFSLVVRDNELINGGQTKRPPVNTVTLNGTAGPFRVTSQNTQVAWAEGAQETVTWDVAGTTANNVNTATVTIKMSTDGGLTFPITLASGTANDGSETVTVPAGVSQTCRLLIQADNNIYYAVNSSNFLLGYTISNQCVTYNYTGGAFAMPDAASGFTSRTINVPTNGLISDVNVRIDATHPNLQNLIISMVRPSGSLLNLFNQQCTGSANMNVVFDQQGSALTCASPTTGTYAPSGTGNLNSLNVNAPAGNWTFGFRDAVAGNTGTINGITLEICKQVVALANQSYNFEDFTIFPNPSSGLFTVNFSSNSNSKVVINVTDISGRKIFDKTYTNTGLFNQDIQLQNAQKGIYLVTVSDGDSKIVKRIVVE
jgi:subtilisin-like proprotein convertase family protein